MPNCCSDMKVALNLDTDLLLPNHDHPAKRAAIAKFLLSVLAKSFSSASLLETNQGGINVKKQQEHLIYCSLQPKIGGEARIEETNVSAAEDDCKRSQNAAA